MKRSMFTPKICYHAILFYVLFLGQLCYASRIFDISISNYGGLTQSYVDSVVTQIESEVLAELPDAEQSEFFQSMANASIMAGKDLGSDPINNIDYAMVVLGVGAGIDLHDQTFDDIKDENGDVDIQNAPGVGAQLGLGLGVHGKFLPKKYFNGEKWSFFINYLPYSYSKDDVKIKIASGGLHMRYKWWNGYDLIRWKMLRLEPVFVTFGYEFNRLKGEVTKDFTESDSTSNGAGGTVDGTFTGRGVIDLEVVTHSLPLSISSGITFLYLVTVYGGLGVDVNFGKAKGSGTLENSSLTIRDTTTGNTATGSAALNLGDESKPKTFFSRAFAGAQVNLWGLKVFAQAEKAFGRNLYGVQAGIKFVF